MDRLWSSLAAAENASRRGTALLKELRRLTVRDDPLSDAWLAERCKLRALIEAHLALINQAKTRRGTASPATAESDEARPADRSDLSDGTGSEALVA